jgi:hypothetical protein
MTTNQKSNMIRKNFYLTKEQSDFLKKQKDLTVSEHIRRALDEYIATKKRSTAVTSPSSRKT